MCREESARRMGERGSSGLFEMSNQLAGFSFLGLELPFFGWRLGYVLILVYRSLYLENK
jgi:hypothetical protein